MAKNPGKIVQYNEKNGEKQKAFMYNSEQLPQFSNYNRAFLRLVNDDMKFKTNEEGKKIISVKHFSELTTIGYID